MNSQKSVKFSMFLTCAVERLVVRLTREEKRTCHTNVGEGFADLLPSEREHALLGIA